jgi:hypothetical protein
MGEVYRARDSELERDVAIKVLPEAVSQNPDRLARFETEAKAVAKLSHPNILDIHDYGREGDITYSVTELLEGSSLRDELARGPLPWRRAREIAGAVATGLAAAHGKGIIHRDLKPENIFVTEDGRVKILDFGLARIHREVGPEDETGTLTPAATRSGTVLGTVGYMAPEQVRGEAADERSDIFALGCVLYEMLAGRRAFSRDSAVETMNAILNEEPPSFSASGIEVGPELARTVERCLEKKLERRFQSAADLAFALRAIVSDTETGPPLGAAGTAGHGRRRLRFGVAAVIALITIGIIGWRSLERPQTAADDARHLPEPAPLLPVERWLVVVEAFDNRTGDSSLDVVSDTLSEILLDELRFVGRGLGSVPPVAVVPAGSAAAGAARDDAVTTPARGRLLITGSYAHKPRGLEVAAQIRELEGGQILYSARPTVVSRRPDRGELEELLQRLMGGIGLDLHVGLEHVSHVPGYRVFVDYLSGVEEVWSGIPAAIERVERAFAADPEFLRSAWFLYGPMVASIQYDPKPEYLDHIRARADRLTEFERLELEVLESWTTGPAGTGLLAARRLQQLAPNDFLIRFYRAKFADDLNRSREVVGAITEAIERVPRRCFRLRRSMQRLLRRAYDRLGEYELLLELGRQMREEAPGDTFSYLAEAVALVGLNRLEELDSLIEECSSLPGSECDSEWVMVRISMYLAAKGHRQLSIDYGERAARELESLPEDELKRREYYYIGALRAAERWDDYRTVAEARAARTDLTTTARDYSRACVGMAAARTGDSTTAQEIAADVEAAGSYGYAAYVAGYLGERERAVSLIKRSIEEEPGFAFGHFVRWDPDLEPLWGYSPFEELVAPRD